jgi:hypothetical protein
MLYDKFENEAAFRSVFVRPLLTRLGYVGISELHGQNEFGKDFVFAELTPFDVFKYHAAVVKHEPTINQSSIILANSFSQIRQAFRVKFTISDSPAEHRISSVYFFNSGKITDHAKAYFRAELDRCDFGDNVHIFDGERLQQLDLTATIHDSRQYLPRLQGLRNEIRLNLKIWNSHYSTVGGPNYDARSSLTRAMEDYLVAPFLYPPIETNKIGRLIQACQIIDAVNTRLHSAAITPETRQTEIKNIQDMIKKARDLSNEILPGIERLLAQYSPLSKATIMESTASDE